MTFVLFDLSASSGLVAAGLVAGGAIGATVTARRVGRTRGGTGRHDTGQFMPPATAVTAGASDDTASAGRARIGRLPLPSRVAALTPGDEPALKQVNQFADHLAGLSGRTWVDIGRSVAASDDGDRRSTARAILDATIDDRKLGIAAWYVKDAIETSAFIVANAGPKLTSAERRLFAGAHGAAETAALAILVREHLSATDFEALYEPFGEERSARVPAQIFE